MPGIPSLPPSYFVGIDQATRCGYAVLDAQGDRLASGTWDLGVRPGEGAGFRYVRFVGYFRQLLDSFGLDGKNTVVAYEQAVPMRGGNSSEIGGALIGHLQYQCEVRKVPYEGIHYATVKRLAIGGRARKTDMIDAANSRWGLDLEWRETGEDPNGRPRFVFPGGSDNIADALFIADACRRRLSGA